MDQPSVIDIYIGAPIELRSEQRVLHEIIRALEDSRTSAVVFCNFHVDRRQIDFLVATASNTLVIEVKTFGGPVRGRRNGEWERIGAAVDSRKVGNPYDQVLGAKYALLDVMREFAGEVHGYPASCIVVEPRLPDGSDVQVNDYKVTLINADQIAPCLSTPSSTRWTGAQWLAMANHLALRKVATVAAAHSPELLFAEDLTACYRHAFHQLYAIEASRLLPDAYLLDGASVTLSDYSAMVLATRRSTVVAGPSGCGKSLLAMHVALAWQQQGGLCIFLSAKYFELDFKQLLDRNLALLDTAPVPLFSAARRLGFPLLLIVDGYNEVSVPNRLTLTRSLRAMARRHEATILLTSQGDIERPDLLNVAHLTVDEPSSELKDLISRAASGDRPDDAITLLLAGVSSGLEARLVGELGRSLPANASSHAVFDADIRRRLGAAAAQGIALLSRVAAELAERLSFSLSAMELDRLGSDMGISSDVDRAVNDSRLLVRRGGRVSFCHELFQATFTAEAVVRSARGDPAFLLDSLEAPRYDHARRFIIGSIDDERLLDAVLRQVADVDLLVACDDGKCGRKAQRSVDRRIERLWAKAITEAEQLQFEIIDNATPHLALMDDSTLTWAPSDFALLNVIASRLGESRELDRILAAVACLDASIETNRRRLSKAATERKVSLRDELFEIAYVHQSRGAMLSRLVAFVASGGIPYRRQQPLIDAPVLRAWEGAKTPGQQYVLLALQWRLKDHSATVPFVLPLLGEVWRSQPYHLRIALLDCAHGLHEVKEPWREQLVVALDNLVHQVPPLMSGMVLEALQQLGALESDEAAHLISVRAELQELLHLPRDELSNMRARSFFDAQFDHPFAMAYSDAIEEITSEERKYLWMMACEGTEHAGLFLSILIRQLVGTNDPLVATAIEKWTQLPDEASFMPQEALRVFIIAHMALGSLAVSLLPLKVGPESPCGTSLRACGALCYWLARPDHEAPSIEGECRTYIHALMAPDAAHSAAGALMLTEQSLAEPSTRLPNDARISLIQAFPNETIEICRGALRKADIQVTYFASPFRSDHEEIQEFAVGVLGTHGDDSDLCDLRALSQKKRIGVAALRAIQAIEQRANTPRITT